ncbi:MAG: hypothetical protein MJE66_20710 [Proteobacteria bacterium]|nr:hypothetical protein [Pseudomonadota bacterium]
MARRSKASFEKRAREKKKAEKAAQKREARSQRADEAREGDSAVATAEDLAGYGVATDEPTEADEASDDSEPGASPSPSGGLAGRGGTS